MPETRRVKPLNLTTAQARRLLDSGKLLVVEALQTQCVTRRWRTGWLYPCVEPEDQRWGVENMMTDETIESPYQPGDVVPCTERWSNRQSAPGARFDGYVYEASGDVSFGRWEPANRMPPEAIRLRPTVESVECRRVAEITPEECSLSGFGTWARGAYRDDDGKKRSPLDLFAEAWHRRYRRRGEAYAFERAFAWFYTLTTKGR